MIDDTRVRYCVVRMDVQNKDLNLYFPSVELVTTPVANFRLRIYPWSGRHNIVASIYLDSGSELPRRFQSPPGSCSGSGVIILFCAVYGTVP